MLEDICKRKTIESLKGCNQIDINNTISKLHNFFRVGIPEGKKKNENSVCSVQLSLFLVVPKHGAHVVKLPKMVLEALRVLQYRSCSYFLAEKKT